jgi:hypothetical protein
VQLADGIQRIHIVVSKEHCPSGMLQLVTDLVQLLRGVLLLLQEVVDGV